MLLAMEETFKNPVQFSKGLNINDLKNFQGEFHLDLDFKRTKHGIDITEYVDMIPDVEDEEDSDTEDIFAHVEKRTEEMMLSSPEYLTFEELSAKMVDVPCLPSGAVKITILEEGHGPVVPLHAEVTIHYAAYWEKGKVPFDSSLTVIDGNPMRIRLGSGRCLAGLELALTNVRGPTARLLALLQPVVAWGKDGAPPRIRPEPALFVIALYAVKETHANSTFNALSTEEQSKYAVTAPTVQGLWASARDLFHKQRYGRAITTYQQAMYVLSLSRPETEQEKRELKNLKVKQFVNLAVCYYKLNKPQRVIDMCDNIDRIIHIDTHCKALFYKGRAYQMLGNCDAALENYKKALKLESNNKEIGKVLAEFDAKMKKAVVDEAGMWRRVFDNKGKERVAYKVDVEFENGVRELCLDLEKRKEYTKVELPIGLVSDEVACLRQAAAASQLIVEEEGKGKRRRVAVIKKL